MSQGDSGEVLSLMGRLAPTLLVPLIQTFLRQASIRKSWQYRTRLGSSLIMHLVTWDPPPLHQLSCAHTPNNTVLLHHSNLSINSLCSFKNILEHTLRLKGVVEKWEPSPGWFGVYSQYGKLYAQDSKPCAQESKLCVQYSKPCAQDSKPHPLSEHLGETPTSYASAYLGVYMIKVRHTMGKDMRSEPRL